MSIHTGFFRQAMRFEGSGLNLSKIAEVNEFHISWSSLASAYVYLDVTMSNTVLLGTGTQVKASDVA